MPGSQPRSALPNPLAAGPLVTAGGLWLCAWYVALGLLLRLPALAVLAGAFVFVLIGMLGAVAPAFLAYSGSATMGAWVTASPLVTVPAIGLMLATFGRNRGAADHRTTSR